MKKMNYMVDIYPGIFRVWFGPRLFYAVSDPKYIEILMTSPHVQGKAFAYRLFQDLTGGGLFTAPVSRWRKTRKMISPAFNQKVLNTFVDIFVDQTKIFIELMQKKYVGRGEFDILTHLTRFSLDTITETAMGIQIKAQTTDSEVPLWMDRIFEIAVIRLFNIFYHPNWIVFKTALGKEATVLLTKLKSFAGNIITERRNQYEMRMRSGEHEYIDTDTSRIKPFMDLLLEDENNHFSNDELLDEAMTFFIGGTDTSASTVGAALTMLGMHQDVQEKVLAEVLQVIGPVRDVHFSDLNKLKYMDQVIKETLRLIPVAAYIARDVEENVDIGDYVIQRGASIIFGIIKVHRNEKYWPDPLKFDPDRFLPEEIAKRPPGCYLPFSYGPRNCIEPSHMPLLQNDVVRCVREEFGRSD